MREFLYLLSKLLILRFRLAKVVFENRILRSVAAYFASSSAIFSRRTGLTGSPLRMSSKKAHSSPVLKG
jgi:hypothetical protein